MQTQQYRDYMRSDEWEAKKQERIAIDGGCVMCGRPIERIRSVQVHHVTYARLGNENVLTDLCTVRVIRRYTHIITAKESKRPSTSNVYKL